MSRLEDKQQPGRSVASADRESEPRLLTRPVPPEDSRREQPSKHGQHAPERGLRAWAGTLRQRSAASARGRARSRSRARVLAGLAGVCLLLLLFVLGWVLSVRHAAQASLPVLDGDVPVAGLHSAVTVARDAQGVPSITASSLHDLLFAQGYTTASDRLWQMDALRRHGAGELAEVLGPSLLEHDRRQRILQMRATADRAAERLPADQREELEAYAEGVNRFIDTHRGTLPVEFRLLAYKPAPWTPRDSLLVLLVMFQDMSTRFPQKLDREALSGHLPGALLPDLYPVGSWRDLPPAEQNHSITAPHAVEQIPLDPSQAHALPHESGGPAAGPAHALPGELLAATHALAPTDGCADCRSGSNNWVVSGAHTASGKPLLANDMHLNLAIPDTWYELGLHTTMPVTEASPDAVEAASGALDVTGFTLPGLPFVIVGRNPHVAWGVTNLGADVQEVRVEHLRGTGAETEFQRADGSWAAAAHHTERIRVRGGANRTLDVMTTTHAVGGATMETPILSPLYPTEARALSLAWTAYDPAALTMPLLRANAAADGTSLVRSFATFGGPSLNLVWADERGHIGYHAIGFIPVRGPAVQHPRVTAPAGPDAVPPGPPAKDEEEGGQAALTGGTSDESGRKLDFPGENVRPNFVLSAFHPVSRRRSFAEAPRPRARGRGRRRPPAIAKPLAPVTEETVAPPVSRSYTIGSPSSPLPVDARDAAMEWSGYIAYDDLPAVTDPVEGFLVTANSRITPADYPWAVTDDWADPFRTGRIVHLLNGRAGLTSADMLRIDNDVQSDVNQAMGQRIAYALDHASAQAMGADAGRLHQASDMLRSWDGEMRTGSSAAAVLTAVRAALWPALLVPQIVAHDAARGADGTGAPTTTEAQAAELVNLYTWGERTTALELMLQHQPARWLPTGFANWNDFLAAATEHGLQTAHAPADLSRWPYGRMHTVEIAHPVFGQHRFMAKLLGVPATTGAQPAPGDFTTIKAIGAHFGPSERFIADLASADAALGNVTTGESGAGRSAWYLDQFRPWLAGTTYSLPGASTPVVHMLRLLPAGGTS